MPLSDYQLRNSTEYGGNASEQTVTYKYRVPTAGWYANVPAFNDTAVDTSLGTVYFKDYSKRNDENDDDYVYLDLRYSNQENAATIRDKQDADDLWLPDAQTYERPLEYAENYLTKWNYDLYQSTSYSDSTPAFFDTATDTSDADGTQWLWAKESPGDNWKLQAVRTKPGVETFLQPVIIVRYHYWHGTKSTVEAQLKTIATIQTPSETFGYSTGEWLVTSVAIDEDGTKYRGTIEFTRAVDWDNDLYGSGS